MIPVQQAFAKAWQYFQAGQLQDAERHCRQVLEGDPHQVDALNLLGVIAAKTGHNDLAIDYFNQALRLKPTFAAAHNNMGNVFMNKRRLPEAVDSYQQALRVQPDFVEARNNLGNALHQQAVQPEARFEKTPRHFPPAFSLAWKQFQAGQLDEAERLFREILETDPNQAEALHHLALIAGRKGRNDVAVDYLTKAVRLSPDSAVAHNNLGNALARQGKSAEAVASYQQAVRLKSDYPEAYGNMGAVLMEQGKLEEAVSSFQRGLALKPNDTAAHRQLGRALLRQGRPAEAASTFQQALRLSPENAEAHHDLGQALMDQGKFQEAAARFQQALQFKPDMALAHYNVGNALMQQGKVEEALVSFQQALRLKPDFAEAHNNLGNVLREQGRLEDAAASFRQALNLQPNNPEAQSNLGVALMYQGRLQEAVASFQQALDLHQSYLENLEASVTHPMASNPAVRIRGNIAAAHRNRAMAWLMLGDFEQGWREYEWRWQCDDYKATAFREPIWDGSPLGHQTIMLRAEGGFGDTLQFIRYAPLVKDCGGTVLVSCPKPLIPLLTTCAGIDGLVDPNLPLPAFDVQAPLLSLPRILGTSLDQIPAKVPYLSVEADRVARWRDEIGSSPHFKIGIYWQGNPQNRGDRQRSFPLAQLAPLAKLTGVQLFSLQKGAGIEQLGAATCGFPVADLGSRLDLGPGAFMDTAAAMQSLDLIVTPDTAIAHLAGALGVPVWTALPFMADWRWLWDRDDSPWYPTMRLFRQRRLGNWDEVFARIASEVAEVLTEQRQGNTGSP
jgi:tetratricopeptide (TPR) repeat protein